MSCLGLQVRQFTGDKSRGRKGRRGEAIGAIEVGGEVGGRASTTRSGEGKGRATGATGNGKYPVGKVIVIFIRCTLYT